MFWEAEAHQDRGDGSIDEVLLDNRKDLWSAC